MPGSLFCLLEISLLCLISAGQDQANVATKVTPSAPEYDSIRVKTITLSTPAGNAPARVYVPKANRLLPGVVFSHSQVQGTDGRTDLLPLAMRIARSGIAVIVVERALVWPATAPDVNHEGGALTIAALHWLLTHENVDSKRCAYVGPKFRDPVYPSSFRNLGYEDGAASAPWVPLAENSSALVMKELLTQEGQMKIEQYLQRTLGFTAEEKPLVQQQ